MCLLTINYCYAKQGHHQSEIATCCGPTFVQYNLSLMYLIVCIDTLTPFKISRNYRWTLDLSRMMILVASISPLCLVTPSWENSSCILRSDEREHFPRGILIANSIYLLSPSGSSLSTGVFNTIWNPPGKVFIAPSRYSLWNPACEVFTRPFN